MEEEEEGEVGFAFPDVTAQLLLAAAGFQFPPVLTMDGDDTESHFLPPPPTPARTDGRRKTRGPKGAGDRWRAIGSCGAAGAGEGRAPLRLTRAHPSRPARRPSHTRAHSRPRAAAVPRLLQRRPPAADPPAPAAGHRARLRAAGALIVSAIRAGWISPPPTATRAGS